jgi:hypothetical protein
MTDEKWQDIVVTIKEKFKILEQTKENLAPEVGGGTREQIVFIGPLGKIKLERTIRPLVINKRTIGSRRIGSTTKVEYIFSETEKVDKLKVYKWVDDLNDWQELKVEGEAFKI